MFPVTKDFPATLSVPSPDAPVTFHSSGPSRLAQLMADADAAFHGAFS